MVDREPTLLQRMEARGVRLTRQRRLLAELLDASDAQVDAEEIYTRARAVDPAVHRATVYRTLDRLKRLGLIDERPAAGPPGERHVYEVSPPRNPCSLVCRRCGAVVTADPELHVLVERTIVERTGFAANLTGQSLEGTCPRCRRRSD